MKSSLKYEEAFLIGNMIQNIYIIQSFKAHSLAVK